jgi:DNA-binding transcriptional LysR family regulator
MDRNTPANGPFPQPFHLGPNIPAGGSAAAPLRDADFPATLPAMIDKLEMFIALATERHFGRAALACGVTQPSLSSAIRQLEDQLGVQLVFRGSRFQGLTPEGQRVLDWARRIVGDMRALRDEMRTVHAGLSGNLRIGVIPTALPMVADITTPFIDRHPNMRVTILSRTSAEILTGIENLELDAGITYLDNEPLGRVSQVPLFTEFYRLLCAPSSPLAARAQITWAELASEPLCLLTADMQNRRIVNTHLTEAGARVAATVESNSTIALVAHVKSGRWSSVVPKKLAEMFTGSGDLVALPIVEPEAEHLVGLITAKREPQTPVLQALLDEAARFNR